MTDKGRKYFSMTTHFINFLRFIATKHWTKILLGSLFFLFLLDLLFPPPLDKITYSTVISETSGTVLHAFLNDNDKWRMEVSLKEITPELSKAILFKEDRYFYYHLGINPLAIIRAVKNNLLKGRRTSGASTITMQVARLLEPKERSYFNKLREILRALQLERRLSKKEILQLYFNLIPYGSNIEGIKSVAYLYFQKSPDRLSLAEITALSVIPNKPNFLVLGTKNERIITERNHWLNEFKKANLFDKTLINNALNEPLNVTRHEAPKEIPHLAFRLKNEIGSGTIVTTIQRNIQKKTETLVENYASTLRSWGIQNAAVLVIHNPTNEVVAYVGSANFGNTSDGGQVDGVRAIRSPGSTLKPFLYATAFDKGLVTPQTVVYDVPSNFRGFEPENFDEKFNGKVTVAFALANSLNIPAVQVLYELGKESLIERLTKAHFLTIKKQEKELGLSMILGGCGTTLEELTNLYAAFPRNGNFQRAKLTKNEMPEPLTEIFSESSSTLIHQILSQVQRPDFPNNFDYTYNLPKIAWKTGTSYGRRDAWSIGYSDEYTIGVWIGNFSGVGVPELSGATIASPLLFNLFNAINYQPKNSSKKNPKQLKTRIVCSESGLLPNLFCTDLVAASYIEGISSVKKCEHLKSYFINETETLCYCTHCLPANQSVKEKYYQNTPSKYVSFLTSKQIGFNKAPKHNPSCSRVFGSNANAPQIQSPTHDSEYFVDLNDLQALQFRCQSAADVEDVYWYVNQKLIAKAKANEAVFWTPTFGTIEITCVDDHGRKNSVTCKVKSF